MKSRAWGWCAAAVLGAAVTTSAQTGAGSQPSGKTSGQDASGKVTLTGCLQADQNGSTFWLSDAGMAGRNAGKGRPSGAGAEATPPAAGTTGSGSGATSAGSVDQKKATAMAETYRLNATGGVALKPHVGHKVEIMGTLADAGASRTGSGTSAERGTSGSTSPGTPAASGSGAHMKDLENARQVNVTAVKHISPVCEPGKQ